MKRETVSPQSAVGQFFAVWGSSGYGAGAGQTSREAVRRQRGSEATEATEATAPAEQAGAGGVGGVGGAGRTLSRPLRPSG